MGTFHTWFTRGLNSGFSFCLCDENLVVGTFVWHFLDNVKHVRGGRWSCGIPPRQREKSLKIGKVRRRAHAALKVGGRCGTFFTFLENFKMSFWSHYFTAATHFDAFSERRDSRLSLSFRKKLKSWKEAKLIPQDRMHFFLFFSFPQITTTNWKLSRPSFSP